MPFAAWRSACSHSAKSSPLQTLLRPVSPRQRRAFKERRAFKKLLSPSRHERVSSLREGHLCCICEGHMRITGPLSPEEQVTQDYTQDSDPTERAQQRVYRDSMWKLQRDLLLLHRTQAVPSSQPQLWFRRVRHPPLAAEKKCTHLAYFH